MTTNNVVADGPMEATHLSLLAYACSGSELAWNRLYELYQPLIFGWLRRHGVKHHQAEELTQEVLVVISKELPRFDHSGRTGAFRTWVYRITANRARAFWRAGRVRPTATGDSQFLDFVMQMEDPDGELTRIWNAEHDRFVLLKLVDAISSDFEPATMSAFRQLVFEEKSAEDAAQELGMTIGAIYSARSRVLQRLRRECKGIVDASLLS